MLLKGYPQKSMPQDACCPHMLSGITTRLLNGVPSNFLSFWPHNFALLPPPLKLFYIMVVNLLSWQVEEGRCRFEPPQAEEGQSDCSSCKLNSIQVLSIPLVDETLRT